MSETRSDSSDFSCVIDGTTKYGDASDFKTGTFTNATEIKLLADVSPTAAVTISSACTLDLNGKNLTHTTDNVIIVDGSSASLTIKDSTVTTEPTVSSDYKTVTYTAGKIESQGSPIVVQNNATVTLNSGQISCTKGKGGAISLGSFNTSTSPATGNSGNFVMNGGYISAQEIGVTTRWESTATINNGVIYTIDNGCLMDNGSAGAGGTKGSTMNITGGTLIGNITSSGYASMVVYRANKGVLNVTGGKLVSTNGVVIGARVGKVNIGGDAELIALRDPVNPANGKLGDSQVVLNAGDAIVYDTSAQYPETADDDAVNISGGTITGQHASVAFSPSATNKNTLNITGGTLNGDINNEAGQTSSGGSQTNGTGIINISGGQVNGDVKSSGAGTTSVSGGSVRNVENTGTGSTEISGGSVRNIVTNTDGSTKITGTAQITGDVTNSGGTTEISGGTVKGNVNSTGSGTTTKITGTAKVNGNVTSSEATTEVSGGQIKGSVDSSNIAEGYEKDANGNIIAKAAWVTLDSSNATKYSYVLAQDLTNLSDPTKYTVIASATYNGSSAETDLKADKVYKLLGVPSTVTDFAFTDNTATVGYAAAEYSTTSATEITITPKTTGVKIIGTNFIGDTITKLTASGSSGIVVDATDNKLTNITGGTGDDSLVAGKSGGTLDGGAGNNTLVSGAGADSLNGGAGNDSFHYSAGNDTVNGFASGDKVYVSGQTKFTDGNQISTIDANNNFKITFSSGNSLTFTNADAPVEVSDGTNNYTYTKDFVKQSTSVTLAAGLTQFNAGDSSQASLSTITAIDGSDVTTAIKITGNAQNNYIIGSDKGGTLEGGAGNDTLVGGSGNNSLDGGEGNDNLVGGSGTDTYLFSGGEDTITGYTYGTDVVSVTATGVTAPTDFTKATYDGSNLKITFDSNNILTFNNAATVAVAQNNSIYTYEAAGNKLKYIALTPATSGDGAISLGAGYTNSQFNGSASSNENYATIDAANVTQKIRIRGNDKANYIVSSSLGGVLEGNDEGDTLNGSGAKDSLTLNGGAGNDLLEGGSGYNYFIYSEGSDSIKNYRTGNLINVTGREVSFADVSVSKAGTDDLLIKFDNSNQLSISGGASADSVISLTSGRNNYAVTKDYIALNGKSITLAASHDSIFNGAAEDYTTYATINAGLVEGDISIVGNANNNYIVGGLGMNSLDGGASDDTLVGGTTAGKTNLFYYTAGKDVIENFGASKDKLDISDSQVEKIANGKLTNSKLTFTVDKNNSLTFKFGDNAPFESVSLQSSAYLTKDGVVSVTSGDNSPRSLTLFASAKGRINLNDELYSIAGASAISTVDAEKVKSQSVTLVGGTKGGLFKYYDGNKQRDGFEYGGGTVSISGYEGGRDRIDLGDASLSRFTVNSDDVVLNIGDSNTISIAGAAGEEVLLRDPTKGNGYKKMVFTANGVVQNKAKNPTMATVSAGAGNYSFADSNHNAQTVKKIYVTDVAAGASIRAGDKYNTVIDASKATNKVSLSGGAKNDKLIGSTGDAADLFVYTGGKDVIQNFGSSDQISLTGSFNDSLKSAKITAAKKSIKFKFDNKNVLTIKSNETMSGELTINGGNKIYFKNAIGGSNGSVSLTSGFSGTFKTQDSNRTALPKAATVNGSAVEKNLTFKGSSDAETLIGGRNKNRKTMFRGGGGADSLVGGDSKDTFFYAKGNTGDATIANFDFANDKIKVSSGIISKIEKSGDSAIKFSMTNGKSTDAAVGSFTITSKGDGKSFDASKVAIKANNTYYWFTESGSDTTKYYSASTGEEIGEGTLITTENRLKSAPSDGYAIIDLNYSTNLAKNDIVAVKATTTKPNTTTT